MTNYKNKIIELHTQGLVDREIGQILNRSISAIQYQRTKLNLPKNGRLGKKIKRCVKCDNIKPLDQFHLKQSSRNSYDSHCKPCASIKSKMKARNYTVLHTDKWYENLDPLTTFNCTRCNKQKLHNYFYVQKQKPRGFKYICKNCYDVVKNIEFYLTRVRNRANQRNLEFSLNPEDLQFPKTCPILNVPLHNIFSNRKRIEGEYYSSLDRIDNTKGYIKGNVIIISRLANTMKNCASFEQLEDFSKNILTLINNHKTEGALGSVTDIFPNIELVEFSLEN